MIKTISLHSRLLIACMVPISILMILFSIFVILFRFQDIDSLKQDTAHTLLQKYSVAIAQSEPAQWQNVLTAALNEKYIHSIDIFDRNGQKLHHAGLKATLKVLDPVKLRSLGDKASYLPYNDAEIFLSPIQSIVTSDNKQRAYWLSIELQPSIFTIARYESIIGISIITFGFISILMLWISSGIRYWLNPLHQMLEQLQEINPQNLEKRLESNALGDLLLLEQQINLLLNKISDEHQELKQSIQLAQEDLEANIITIESHNIELRLARNAAVEGNRIKSAFLANISHELRTPLNSINGFTQLLLKMQLTVKQRDWIESIEKSSNNLLSIINDVLDFSKIEAGKFSLQIHPLNLENMIFDVLESLAPQAENKGLEQIAFIYEDVPLHIKGDALRLKQILTNLVSNAIRFTNKGEVIVRVMLEETRHEHHFIKISVTDTGKGLSDNEKAHLFTAFQQGNPSLSREAGGTGLGLVISKSLVKLMEGDIGFDADRTEGAMFWFRFKAEIDNQAIPSPPILLTDKKILVLESHIKNAQLLKSVLFNAEADVKIVSSWDELYTQSQESYQVIILDSHDLQQDCYHQLYSLRQHFSGMLVLLTGLNDVQSLSESTFNDLAIYTLSKPIRPIHLLNLLGQGFSTARFKQNFISVSTKALTANLHILAVDDHPLNLKLVCTLLEDCGIKVSSAENGLQAIQSCQQHKFDLIFMDIQMPQMSGLEATQHIRTQDNLNKNTPIVALTAHALADEQENMRDYGMSDYLTKPLQEAQLIDIIQRWTGVNLKAEHTAKSLSLNQNQMQPIDWQECLKLSLGKHDLARDMIKMLIDGIPNSKEKLYKSLEEYNLAALLAHAHYLHGATRYCGVPRLRLLTRQLETTIKESLKYKTDGENHTKTQITQQATAVLQQLDELYTVDLEAVMSES